MLGEDPVVVGGYHPGQRRPRYGSGSDSVNVCHVGSPGGGMSMNINEHHSKLYNNAPYLSPPTEGVRRVNSDSAIHNSAAGCSTVGVNVSYSPVTGSPTMTRHSKYHILNLEFLKIKSRAHLFVEKLNLK